MKRLVARKQRVGPLKVITKVLRKSIGLFEQGLVELECGHRVRSNSVKRARCGECGKVGS